MSTYDWNMFHLKIKRQDEFSFPRFTLPDEKNSVADERRGSGSSCPAPCRSFSLVCGGRVRVVQDQLGGIRPGQGAVEPGVVGQNAVSFWNVLCKNKSYWNWTWEICIVMFMDGELKTYETQL